MNTKTLFLLGLLGIALVSLASCTPAETPTQVIVPTELPPTKEPTEPPPPPTAIPANVLAAYHSAEAPVLDGVADDAIWAQAPEMALSSPKLTLKAVYTDTDFYMLAIVPDTTASFTRSGAWIWDGAGWSTVGGQSEDRLAVMWSMDTPNFEAVGCMTKCHPGTNAEGGEDDAWLETGVADMWHMKAARALPAQSISQSGTLSIDEASHEVTAGKVAFMGWVDDKWVGPWSADNAPDGGRYGDAGGGAYGHNRNADKTGPMYIELAPADYVDAMTMTQAEVDGGEAVEVASLSAEDLQAAWDAYDRFKAVVPERVLHAPGGSRADVLQAAIWEDGVWTLEMQRALDTGHPEDDVIFNDLSLPYLFGVSYMDNTDGAEHIVSGTLSLVFLP